MRFRRSLSTFFGVLGTLFIGIVITLFLVFPRVVNQLADRFGNMGTSETFPYVDMGLGVIHAVIALVIDLLLFYFFIYLPSRALQQTLETPGLMIRKGEGLAYIDPESVRQQVLGAISQVAGIKHADVNVENDAGRAIIRMNIITDISLNGPKKKNEVNREVRKIVQDQLGIDLADKPMINFTFTSPDVPLITSRTTSTETPPAPRYEDRPISPIPPTPSYAARPSGIDLAKQESMGQPMTTDRTPAPEPIKEVEDTHTMPSPSADMVGTTDAPSSLPFERKPWQSPGVVTDLGSNAPEEPDTERLVGTEPAPPEDSDNSQKQPPAEA